MELITTEIFAGRAGSLVAVSDPEVGVVGSIWLERGEVTYTHHVANVHGGGGDMTVDEAVSELEQIELELRGGDR